MGRPERGWRLNSDVANVGAANVAAARIFLRPAGS